MLGKPRGGWQAETPPEARLCFAPRPQSSRRKQAEQAPPSSRADLTNPREFIVPGKRQLQKEGREAGPARQRGVAGIRSQTRRKKSINSFIYQLILHSTALCSLSIHTPLPFLKGEKSSMWSISGCVDVKAICSPPLARLPTPVAHVGEGVTKN